MLEMKSGFISPWRQGRAQPHLLRICPGQDCAVHPHTLQPKGSCKTSCILTARCCEARAGCTAVSLCPSSAPCSHSSKAALKAFKSMLLQATVLLASFLLLAHPCEMPRWASFSGTQTCILLRLLLQLQAGAGRAKGNLQVLLTESACKTSAWGRFKAWWIKGSLTGQEGAAKPNTSNSQTSSRSQRVPITLWISLPRDFRQKVLVPTLLDTAG